MAEELNKQKIEKPTYEQLEEYARQLTQQAQMMGEQLKKTVLGETIARLDFSFKVLDHKDFFDEAYVKNIAEEITKVLAVEDETKETEEPPMKPAENKDSGVKGLKNKIKKQ